MFFKCLILGSRNLNIGINFYLQSLIDDVKKLWSDVETYDMLLGWGIKVNWHACIVWTIQRPLEYTME